MDAPTDSNASAGLPPAIEMAWGLRARPAKGPKPGLTLERIVSAGIKVALTDGLGSVSMSRVAAELGGSTMSLYRYVAAKDDLLQLMVDAALGAAPGAHMPGDGWRNGLERWARAEHAAYRRHPWALRVPMSAPPLGPNNVEWLEDALRCVARTKLTEQQKLSSVLLLSGFVRNVSTLTADLTAGTNSQPASAGYGSMLAELITAERFPALSRAVESGALDDDDDELSSEFEFGLERVLDGIEVLVKSAARRHRTR
jgi:AcrR family transcriptional regulator